MADVEAGDDVASPLALDLGDLAAGVRARRWSAAAVTEAALQRIAPLDAGLHAFCTLDADGARAQAARIDARLAAGEDCGPLAGVPVAVKDLICTAGLRTTFGSRLYADHVPEEDDVVVERLRCAGAVILGKTNTSEFGYGAVGHNPLFPTTRNPWNPALTPGGSSAGSAAAVAARMVPLALGSDGGGSVRIPASLSRRVRHQALVGPRSRLPGLPRRAPSRHLELGVARAHRPDHAHRGRRRAGPLGAGRADAARPPLAAGGVAPTGGCRARNRCAAGASPSASTWAMPWSTPRSRPPSSRRRFACRRRSAPCSSGACPAIGDTQPMFETLVALDTDRAGLKELAARRGVVLTGWLASLVERRWTGDEFTAATMARKRIVNTTWRFMEEHDFLLTPTTAAPAFAIDLDGPERIDGRAVAPTAWIAFSALANLTGLPAASVPIGFTADGRPIGLQITGRHLDDRGVLALSAVVESLFPRQRWPGPPLARAA